MDEIEIEVEPEDLPVGEGEAVELETESPVDVDVQVIVENEGEEAWEELAQEQEEQAEITEAVADLSLQAQILQMREEVSQRFLTLENQIQSQNEMIAQMSALLSPSNETTPEQAGENLENDPAPPRVNRESLLRKILF